MIRPRQQAGDFHPEPEGHRWDMLWWKYGFDQLSVRRRNKVLRRQAYDWERWCHAAEARSESLERWGPLALCPDLLEEAWLVIANAHGGDWDKATGQWRAAAARWQDRYHSWLGLPKKSA